MLDEFSQYYRAASALNSRATAAERNKLENLAWLEENDLWAKAKKERPEWLATVRKEIGLEEKLVVYAKD